MRQRMPLGAILKMRIEKYLGSKYLGQSKYSQSFYSDPNYYLVASLICQKYT